MEWPGWGIMIFRHHTNPLEQIDTCSPPPGGAVHHLHGVTLANCGFSPTLVQPIMCGTKPCYLGARLSWTTRPIMAGCAHHQVSSQNRGPTRPGSLGIPKVGSFPPVLCAAPLIIKFSISGRLTGKTRHSILQYDANYVKLALLCIDRALRLLSLSRVA